MNGSSAGSSVLKFVAGRNAPGMFVTFEGGDGSGKSTHMRFLADVLIDLGFDVVCLREPGGTRIGEQLRSIVLDGANREICSRAELLIYEAARAQLVHEEIAPALARGAIVLCDRFTDSTVAYQGYGRALDVDFINECNAFATCGVVPDVTIVMSCQDRSKKLERVLDRKVMDRIEQAGGDFHAEVDESYLRLAAASPERMRVVETDDAHSATAMRVMEALGGQMPWLSDGTVDLSARLFEFDGVHEGSDADGNACSG